MEKIGKAYGFFDCSASKEEIEAELPIIREITQIPSELELSLIEGMENLKGDSDLMAIAQDAKKKGIRYVLEATYSNPTKKERQYIFPFAMLTNKETAKVVVDILNHAYQPPLYQKGEPFRGEVVYKEGDQYLFRK